MTAVYTIGGGNGSLVLMTENGTFRIGGEIAERTSGISVITDCIAGRCLTFIIYHLVSGMGTVKKRCSICGHLGGILSDQFI